MLDTGNIYFWTEDGEGKSGYTFWKYFLSSIYPNIILESKQNNARLMKAVKNIRDDGNLYIIAMDNSYDNPSVVKIVKATKQMVKNKINIIMLDILCFEFILLEFTKLLSWVYAADDEFLQKRAHVILVREKFLSAIRNGYRYEMLPEITDYLSESTSFNVEKLSAKILFDLTRNTGFQVDKSHLGECWWNDCCNWSGKDDTDKCGLELMPLNCKEKMIAILNGTSLASEIKKWGLHNDIDL